MRLQASTQRSFFEILTESCLRVAFVNTDAPLESHRLPGQCWSRTTRSHHHGETFLSFPNFDEVHRFQIRVCQIRVCQIRVCDSKVRVDDAEEDNAI